ncbi:hypothetical protein [Rossellomorea sp. BNER]|uniref:hypothetical protein n=1 Tax=Rossellomorea sp. BNER TaxID=2962031 RepID=UPI003AF2A75A|nr:hypothetical protein [Rossellomorea sp. BNER]
MWSDTKGMASESLDYFTSGEVIDDFKAKMNYHLSGQSWEDLKGGLSSAWDYTCNIGSYLFSKQSVSDLYGYFTSGEVLMDYAEDFEAFATGVDPESQQKISGGARFLAAGSILFKPLKGLKKLDEVGEAASDARVVKKDEENNSIEEKDGVKAPVKAEEKIQIVDGKKQYKVNGQWITDKQFSALRQKAVRQAWKQEKELVLKTGKGTRNWTPEEKRELLQTGKVKGYEGQHMKSANEYPNFAGDPDNIQFLKGRNMDVNEHLDAHGGNYHNPTNGYYVPKNGIMIEFEDEIPWKPK